MPWRVVPALSPVQMSEFERDGATLVTLQLLPNRWRLPGSMRFYTCVYAAGRPSSCIGGSSPYCTNGTHGPCEKTHIRRTPELSTARTLISALLTFLVCRSVQGL